MRRSGIAALLALSVAWDGTASARQCVAFGDVADAFAQSDLVFVGTVTANRKTGEFGHHVQSDVGTLRVVRTWKGRPSKEVDISADAPFEVGKRDLVFASGKVLSTSIECDWTQLEEHSHDKLEWLKRRFPG